MPEVYTPSLYAVRIPDGLLSLLTDKYDDKVISHRDFIRLDYLAALLPLEDVFYFVYEQSQDANFITFCTEYHVPSILRLDANVAWLNEVKTKYDLYLRKREDMDKVNQKEGENLSVLKNSVLHAHHYQGLCSCQSENVLVFQAGQSDESVAVQKKQMRSAIYDKLGYDHFRRHPVLTFLLVDAL